MSRSVVVSTTLASLSIPSLLPHTFAQTSRTFLRANLHAYICRRHVDMPIFLVSPSMFLNATCLYNFPFHSPYSSYHSFYPANVIDTSSKIEINKQALLLNIIAWMTHLDNGILLYYLLIYPIIHPYH